MRQFLEQAKYNLKVQNFRSKELWKVFKIVGICLSRSFQWQVFHLLSPSNMDGSRKKLMNRAKEKGN